MKTIGLIGGTGWVSTIEYYRIINETVNKKLGGNNFAKCVIYSLNQGDVIKNHDKDDSSGLRDLVSKAAESLVKAGVDVILLGANTLHMVADDIEKKINVPLIHIVSATAEKIKEKGLTKVGLMGTKPTMKLDFFKNKLRDNGIDVIVPEEDYQDYIQKTIVEELVMDKFYDSTTVEFLDIIEDMTHQGAEGIILGCTEISLLISQDDVDIPVFDTTRIHAEAAVDFALGI